MRGKGQWRTSCGVPNSASTVPGVDAAAAFGCGLRELARKPPLLNNLLEGGPLVGKGPPKIEGLGSTSFCDSIHPHHRISAETQLNRVGVVVIKKNESK